MKAALKVYIKYESCSKVDMKYESCIKIYIKYESCSNNEFYYKVYMKYERILVMHNTGFTFQ